MGVPVREVMREVRRCRDMRKMTVWVGMYGGGEGAAPLRPVPVQISTWSLTLRCVAGIAANSGALNALVIPGSTIGVNPFSLKNANSSAPRP